MPAAALTAASAVAPPCTQCHLSRNWHCSELTTNSSASIATIAVVASGNTTVTTEVATVATSSIGIVSIVVATIAPIATNNSIAAAATTTPLLVHIVVSCIGAYALHTCMGLGLKNYMIKRHITFCQAMQQ